MKKVIDFLKQDWVCLLFLGLPFLVLLKFWDILPEKIPTHFGITGQPNDYSGDKVTGALLVPCINIFVYVLILVLPYIDPRGNNYELFDGTLQKIKLLLVLLFDYTFGVILYASMHPQSFNPAAYIIYGTIVFIMMLGNYFSTLRFNYFIGIKVPWTLNSEEIWNKTHRFAGKFIVIISLLTIAINLIFSLNEYVLGIYISMVALVPIVYSFILYQKEKGKIHHQ